ncbi:hypothetical protein E1B28_012515 [Marasmius oreades]|uniref:Protein PBN1 n=1 Tax=Marasmius oreades TaxID=181124 RepID=A0A9P7UNB7_9AGAR|nr:uncharacterized protein E1B28_012515 [Marasmius oreades]KAG7088532.1 hypothetical protein E1B28_012515 [Marasmius oreades]
MSSFADVDLSYTISENGYHPTITVNWNSSYNAACSLHILLSLPPVAYVDPYELQTSYADHYAVHLIGHRGLELPAMAVDNQESHLLLDVKKAQETNEPLDIPIPIHFRYAALSSSHTYGEVKILAPKGFMACSSLEQEREQRPSHDLTVLDLPTEFRSLFSNHLSVIPISKDGPLFSTLRVPIGNPLHITHVELGTSITVIACFLYLSWLSWRTKIRLDEQEKNSRMKKLK